MQHTYFTVGPSQVYPTVPAHLRDAINNDVLSLSHRGTEFKNLFARIVGDLKNFLSIPEDYDIVFIPSATEGMERTLQGVVEKQSFHIVHGSFGQKFKEIADDLGKETQVYQLDLTKGDQEIMVPESSELICLTQNDTSNGSWIPPRMISAIKKKYPDKLLSIDIVSSIPVVALDFTKIDIAFFSVQKGFGLPAGLGVMVISPQAREKAHKVKAKGLSIGSYHSILHLIDQARQFQTPETPNVLNIYLFQKVLQDMMARGVELMRKESDKKAQKLYTFFDSHRSYKPVIKLADFRSPTVLVIEAVDTHVVHHKLSKEMMLVGKGYGEKRDLHLRIANFPSHTEEQIDKLISVLS